MNYQTNEIANAYSEFKNRSDGYGDMKSFICFDAGFRAALQFLENKFTLHNNNALGSGRFPQMPSLEAFKKWVSVDCHTRSDEEIYQWFARHLA